MAQKYFCAHCDQEFVPETAGDKPRCPSCMRRGGVQAVSTPPADVRGGGRTWLVVLVLALIGGGIGYSAYRATVITLEDRPPVRPLKDKELTAYLERDQVPVGKLGGVFALPGAGDWPSDPASLAMAISAETAPWGLDQPLSREVFTADEALAAFGADDSRVRVYPLEAAVAMTALLREQGQPAMVAEAWDLGEQAPPDPSGLFGYFVVAIDDGEQPTKFFDPWGGRADVSPVEVRVVRDTEVIAAALGADSMGIFTKSGDGVKALPLVETALSLDPTSPSLRGVHGMVMLETGGVTSGAKELEAALQLRTDAPRELNLVQLALAQAAMLQMAGEEAAAGAELGSANQSITQVIEKWPAYARAHRMLATLHFGADEPERARSELQIAQKLDPNSAMLWTLWGQYYLSQGDPDSAAIRVKRAVVLDPDNWQLRLQVARVLVLAGDLEGGQEQVAAALELVPAQKREELKRYLADALGPSVLGDGAPPRQGGAFDLSAPGIGAAPRGSAPDLQDPALMLGDPSDLRLRNPDKELRLDLDN